MKARVIATGKIVDVVANGNYYDTTDNKERYYSHELDFNDTADYWTRLEHQYAGMAMQGMLNNSLLITSLLKVNKSHEDIVDEVTGTAVRYAHALVEKLKEGLKYGLNAPCIDNSITIYDEDRNKLGEYL